MEIEKPEAIASAQGGGRRGWKWVRRAGYASVGGFAILLAALAQPGLAGRADPFFLIPVDENPLALSVQNRSEIPFRLIEVKNGISTHVLDLEGSAELLVSPTIGLAMLSNWKSGPVVSGRIDFFDPTTGEVTGKYKVRQGSVIREARKLEFVKRESSPAGVPAGPQKVTIKITSVVGPYLGLMGQFAEGEALSRMLYTPSTSIKGQSGFTSAQGWYEKPTSRAAESKADLLAYTWDFSGGGLMVYILVLCAVGVWIAGSFALLKSQLPGMQGGFVVAIGASLLYLSLGSVFCLIFPPFHAPDEPDHFLTYAQLIEKPALATDALRIAKIGHFERIKFRTDEKFVSSDVGEPEISGWAPHVAETNLNRSPVAKIVWQIAGKVLSGSHAGSALFSLRLVNVLFVALCLGVALAAAAVGRHPDRPSIFIAAPAILTPAIAFFSMGVSNYSFLIGAYIIQAVAVGVLWAQARHQAESSRAAITGATLAGAGLTLAICSSDNGVFGIAFWATLIPLYWFLRGLSAKSFGDELLVCRKFFLTYFSAIAGSWLFIGYFSGSYRVLPLEIAAFFEKVMPAVLFNSLGAQGIIFLGYAIPLVLLSVALLLSGSNLKSSGWVRMASKYAVWPLLLGMAFVFFAKTSLIPNLRSVTIPEYAGRIIYSFFEGFGPGESDWLITQSFWGVYGWLDTPLPVLFNEILRWVAALGFLGLILSCARSNKFLCGTGFAAANILGITVALAFISAGYYYMTYGVNGRYIIAPYLLILTAAYEGYRRVVLLRFPGQDGAVLSAALICLAAGVIHCTAWTSVLNRYF